MPTIPAASPLKGPAPPEEGEASDRKEHGLPFGSLASTVGDSSRTRHKTGVRDKSVVPFSKTVPMHDESPAVERAARPDRVE